MSPLYDEETGEPNYELTTLELDVLRELANLTKDQNLDMINDNHLTSYNIGNFSPAIVRAIIRSLVKKGLIARESDDQGRSDWWEFTPDGAELAYSLTDPRDIPSADRFVSISHNSTEFNEAVQALSNLSKEVRDSNILFADKDERIQVSKEIEYIKELISAPRIHVSSLISIAKNNRTIQFLFTQTASEIVKQAAHSVMEKLGPLVHLIRSLM